MKTTVKDVYQSIVKDAIAKNNAKDIFDYLDKAIVVEKESGKDRMESTIKSITRADLPCPVEPKCIGTIDAIIRCIGGLSQYVRKVNNDCCPVKVSIVKGKSVALPLPASGIFDYSTTMAQMADKECIILTPEYIYHAFEIDYRLDECNSCGELAGILIADASRAVALGIEKEIMSAVLAVGGAATTYAGTLTQQMMSLYNALADKTANSGKNIVIFVNAAIIRRVKQELDDNGNFKFTYENVCPTLGCQELCFGGVKLVSLDDLLIPITGVTTQAIGVVVDNVMATYSSVVQKQVAWDQTLLGVNNRIVTMTCVKAVVPPMFASDTAKIANVTIS